ncbi:MAG: hypothetical protein U0228_12615 [Myxococcaceae bacterium]
MIFASTGKRSSWPGSSVRLARAIVFVVGEGVRSVAMEVPTFWLGVTGRRELELRAIAIVTRNAAVRVAARGFALANKVRGLGTVVETFDDRDAGIAWAAAELNQTKRLDSDSAR